MKTKSTVMQALPRASVVVRTFENPDVVAIVHDKMMEHGRSH